MTDTVLQPGAVIAHEAEALDGTSTGIVHQRRVLAGPIGPIIHDKRANTDNSTMRLGRWCGAATEFWMDANACHALRCAAKGAGKAIRALPAQAEKRRPESQAQVLAS